MLGFGLYKKWFAFHARMVQNSLKIIVKDWKDCAVLVFGKVYAATIEPFGMKWPLNKIKYVKYILIVYS